MKLQNLSLLKNLGDLHYENVQDSFYHPPLDRSPNDDRIDSIT